MIIELSSRNLNELFRNSNIVFVEKPASSVLCCYCTTHFTFRCGRQCYKLSKSVSSLGVGESMILKDSLVCFNAIYTIPSSPTFSQSSTRAQRKSMQDRNIAPYAVTDGTGSLMPLRCPGQKYGISRTLLTSYGATFYHEAISASKDVQRCFEV